jgi:hypothetical protein
VVKQIYSANETLNILREIEMTNRWVNPTWTFLSSVFSWTGRDSGNFFPFVPHGFQSQSTPDSNSYHSLQIYNTYTSSICFPRPHFQPICPNCIFKLRGKSKRNIQILNCGTLAWWEQLEKRLTLVLQKTIFIDSIKINAELTES